MKSLRGNWRVVVTAGLLCSIGPALASAIAPTYQTDFEISQYPIVVVASWNKAAVTCHDLVEGNVRREFEAFTELSVERVIRGDLKPGSCRVIFGWGIGWNADGTGLATWTSTDIPGDVEDLTKPNLWFLDRARSWDKSDATEYVHIPHYRAIQPLALEPYFQALLRADRDQEVPRLLASRDPLVVRRALRYVCGEIWPYPYEPAAWELPGTEQPKKRERMLVEAVPAVKQVIAGNLEELRPLAVALYAELVQASDANWLRALLTDRNATVRGVAVALLAHRKDPHDINALAKASSGVEDATIACKIIEGLRNWNEPQIAPILISFLENDKYAYRYGDDFGYPALKARAALQALTKCWFPYDVDAGAEAWAKVERIDDPAERLRRLAELVPDPEFPLVAELVGQPRKPPAASTQPVLPASAPASTESQSPFGANLNPGDMLATVRVRNVVGHAVTIGRIPSGEDQDWPSGGSGRSLGPRSSARTSADYVSLAPSDAIEFEIVLANQFLAAEPATRKLTLWYGKLGTGPGTWFGSLPVQFGAFWHEERRAEHVEKRWPNGNLRAVGETINGRPFGEWQYFNEAGDRICIAHHGSGGGEEICDPEHPDNKGAGRPKPGTTQPAKP